VPTVGRKMLAADFEMRGLVNAAQVERFLERANGLDLGVSHGRGDFHHTAFAGMGDFDGGGVVVVRQLVCGQLGHFKNSFA